MSIMGIMQEQANWMLNLLPMKSTWLNAFFYFINYWDTAYFIYALFAVTWLFFGKQYGVRLAYMMTLGAIITQLLKVLFAIPRPFVLQPALEMIHLTNYSFPSGAAQSSMLLSGIILTHYKKKWIYPVLACYLLLIAFSRIYLSVHYPTDILGGWIVGVLLVTLYRTLYFKVERYLENQSPLMRFAYWGGFFALLFLLITPPFISRMALWGFGIAAALYLIDKSNLHIAVDSRWLLRLIFAILATTALILCSSFMHTKFLMQGLDIYVVAFVLGVLEVLIPAVLAASICWKKRSK